MIAQPGRNVGRTARSAAQPRQKIGHLERRERGLPPFVPLGAGASPRLGFRPVVAGEDAETDRNRVALHHPRAAPRARRASIAPSSRRSTISPFQRAATRPNERPAAETAISSGLRSDMAGGIVPQAKNL